MKEVYLVPMTAEMYFEYYREYENDPDLYADKAQFKPFVYDPEWVKRYIQRQRDLNRLCFAVMLGEEMAGEVILKDIEPHQCATLSICMRNAAYKNRGIGTRAERLAAAHVFEALDIPVLYADAVLANARSRHVLEKVGFVETRRDGAFAHYRLDRDSWRAKSS